METTLLLDAAFLPVRIMKWEEAFVLWWLGKVNIVEQYDRGIGVARLHDDGSQQVVDFEGERDGIVQRICRPAVVYLPRYVERRKHYHPPKLHMRNLLIRDDCQCQYCGLELNRSTGTMDHVLPKSRGGEHSWTNVVLSCTKCNNRKADRTPKEAKMPLRRKPVEPKYLSTTSRKALGEKVPPAWEGYLVC